ncbi:MAG: NAD-dependent epimerase/dehydratase family protein [Armatimonadota bacterium]|nr:NAD-dependent epimerase/dehydratase family protein [Armatimonadota bacterium]MDR7438213.1 NAD-dependent epimerase/dehydratase family protein [Armatimonadota bacterium]MDR7471515.1 NAD-dependent epimerase/dehydratase family protein [Armatimonadota bacterium]MDR7508144.1 NAD-dependent epimerase/dehydratase family protein [Armatimonadota bacterium]MDR7509573.1 NAD-dependent epimerase/dehydratase family protein [Armatimonadota bacterium]
MRVLVTGGAGFVGSHVAEAYLAAGHQVAVVDNLSTGRPEHVPSRAAFYPVDIRSAQLREVFERERPEVVNHHAAQASVAASVADPRADADVNVLGTVHLLTLCAQFGVRRFVFASTGGAIYGEPLRLPVDEDHPCAPLSPYGTSKLAAEAYVRLFGRMGLSWAALRYGNVYGPRQDPMGEAGVVAIFARAMLDGRAPTIFGDGQQTRDFVYVEDVARANLLATDAAGCDVVNLGTGTETSVAEIFRILAALTGFRDPPRFAPPRPGDVRRIALDGTRARRWLGWAPQVPLEEGLRRTVDWLRITPPRP